MSEEQIVKIGMYTTDEIYRTLADGMLQRSMVDAMYFKIKEQNQALLDIKEYIEKDEFVDYIPNSKSYMRLMKNRCEIKEILDKVNI